MCVKMVKYITRWIICEKQKKPKTGKNLKKFSKCRDSHYGDTIETLHIEIAKDKGIFETEKEYKEAKKKK